MLFSKMKYDRPSQCQLQYLLYILSVYMGACRNCVCGWITGCCLRIYFWWIFARDLYPLRHHRHFNVSI